MPELKPLIKRSHHVVVSDAGHVAIGEIPGLSSILRDPPPWVPVALRRFDGAHTVQRVLKEVHITHPDVRIEEVEALAAALDAAHLLERIDDDLTELTPREQERYDRQMLQYTLFDRAGVPGTGYQTRLKRTTATVFGMGGWGTWLSLHLALNGFGGLRVVDGDTVERSNLNRQVLYSEDQLGHYKVDAAREALARINPHVAVDGFPEFATNDEARLREFITGAGIVFIAWASLGFYRKDTIAEKIHLIAEELRVPVCELGGDPLEISVGPIFPYDRGTVAYATVKAKNRGQIYDGDDVVRDLQRARMKNQFDNGNRTVNAWQSSPSLSVMAGLLVDQAVKYVTGYGESTLVGRKFVLDMGTLRTRTVEVL
ncbi:ThiF family adenylyltransferase [Actinokineospora auranticolor]|uniref:Molybdopterin/thiamine biosynthesis adenylyltransferase n=1 Tax=Actinokineospora auranticolor TaxID=155976 RepID=A0A2S6GK25_9PSEU|nr:ThiF family adenylyltransferase [Actinokineospora auranticolor]PPK65540.1 molybdopterin/thiamine biosynthesis adenylyltransferase [Actinokineospora auranticolor]